jgi:hypothetical protein
MGGDVRFVIPPALLEGFSKEPHVLLKHHPAGLWPVDIRWLFESGLWKELASDKEFAQNYELVIMPR